MTKRHIADPNRPGYTRCGRSVYMRGLPTSASTCSVCISAIGSTASLKRTTTNLSYGFKPQSDRYTPPATTTSSFDIEAELKAIREDSDRRMAEFRKKVDAILKDAELDS